MAMDKVRTHPYLRDDIVSNNFASQVANQLKRVGRKASIEVTRAEMIGRGREQLVRHGQR
jgi:hypothetical protein